MAELTGRLNVKQVKKESGGSDTVFRAFMTVLDWLLMDERAQVNGIVFIIDQTGFTLEHKLDVYNFDNIKRVFAALQNSYPFRVKEFHFYNSPQLFEAMFALIKNFLKPKLRQRMVSTQITIHGKNLVNLYEKVDMRVLPDEYLPDEYTGPSSGSLQTIIENMRMEITEPSVSDFIKSLSTNYGIDLKQKPIDADLEAATFRKLNVQ